MEAGGARVASHEDRGLQLRFPHALCFFRVSGKISASEPGASRQAPDADPNKRRRRSNTIDPPSETKRIESAQIPMAASAGRLVPMLAFCEAPFDGTLDGTSAPSSPAASTTSGGGDAAARRRALLMDTKQLPPTSQRREHAQRGGAVDGLTIFEAVALQ